MLSSKQFVGSQIKYIIFRIQEQVILSKNVLGKKIIQMAIAEQ